MIVSVWPVRGEAGLELRRSESTGRTPARENESGPPVPLLMRLKERLMERLRERLSERLCERPTLPLRLLPSGGGGGSSTCATHGLISARMSTECELEGRDGAQCGYELCY